MHHVRPLACLIMLNVLLTRAGAQYYDTEDMEYDDDDDAMIDVSNPLNIQHVNQNF